jgi:hypothetical protein
LALQPPAAENANLNLAAQTRVIWRKQSGIGLAR